MLQTDRESGNVPWKQLSTSPEAFVETVEGVSIDWRDPSHLNAKELKTNWVTCFNHQTVTEDGDLVGQYPFRFKAAVEEGKPRKSKNEFERSLAAARAMPGYVELDDEEDSGGTDSDADDESGSEPSPPPRGRKRTADSMAESKSKRSKSSRRKPITSAELVHSSDEEELDMSRPKKKKKDAATFDKVSAGAATGKAPRHGDKGKGKAPDASDSEVELDLIQDILHPAESSGDHEMLDVLGGSGTESEDASSEDSSEDSSEVDKLGKKPVSTKAPTATGAGKKSSQGATEPSAKGVATSGKLGQPSGPAGPAPLRPASQSHSTAAGLQGSKPATPKASERAALNNPEEAAADEMVQSQDYAWMKETNYIVVVETEGELWVVDESDPLPTAEPASPLAAFQGDTQPEFLVNLTSGIAYKKLLPFVEMVG